MSDISWAILGGVVFAVLVRLEGPRTGRSRLGPLGPVVMLIPAIWYTAQIWTARRGSVAWSAAGFVLACSAFQVFFWNTLRLLAIVVPGKRDD